MSTERHSRERFMQECALRAMATGARSSELGDQVLELYAELWHRIEKLERRLHERGGPPPRPPPTSVPGPGVPRGPY